MFVCISCPGFGLAQVFSHWAFLHSCYFPLLSHTHTHIVFRGRLKERQTATNNLDSRISCRETNTAQPKNNASHLVRDHHGKNMAGWDVKTSHPDQVVCIWLWKIVRALCLGGVVRWCVFLTSCLAKGNVDKAAWLPFLGTPWDFALMAWQVCCLRSDCA